MPETKKPILSISMLVSNGRRDTIEKCMESLLPLRAAISNELILVDTGCTDGSIDLAKKYADKVISFTWCNDFAAARNAGLFACSGEWFLYLDDDEWFEDTTEIIQFFQSGEYKKYDGAWYLQRNYGDFEGSYWSDTYVGRMCRLTSETAFYGKIHEWLEPFAEKIKFFQSYVHHYGYIYKTEEERQKKSKRNITLLEEVVKEKQEGTLDFRDVRMLVQLEGGVLERRTLGGCRENLQKSIERIKNR